MEILKKVARSGIWLWLPPLAASFAFWPNLGAAYQPETFWRDIPSVLGFVENVSRFGVIGLSCLLLFDWRAGKQRTGWLIYLVGLLAYIACQWAIVMDPMGVWASSIYGFMAPAYTPAIWVLGIGVVGTREIAFEFNWARWLYWIIGGLFIVSHNMHAYLVFTRQ